MFEASLRFSECANSPKKCHLLKPTERNLDEQSVPGNSTQEGPNSVQVIKILFEIPRGTPASTRLKYKKHFSQCHQVQVKNLILVLKPKTLKYQHVWDPFFHLVLTDLDSGEKTFVVFVFVISIHRPEICVVGRTCGPGKAFIVFYCLFPRQRIE